MSSETTLILVRWVIALTLIAKGALTLAKVSQGAGEGFAGSAAFALFSFAMIIAGVLLVTRELVPWLSAPLWRFLTNIVFPDDKFEHPPVNYALPRSYRGSQRLDDAIEEYQKILHHHPQELAAYLECIEVMVEAGDLEDAHKVGMTGLRKLRSAEARREVKAKLASLGDSTGLRFS